MSRFYDVSGLEDPTYFLLANEALPVSWLPSHLRRVSFAISFEDLPGSLGPFLGSSSPTPICDQRFPFSPIPFRIRFYFPVYRRFRRMTLLVRGGRKGCRSLSRQPTHFQPAFTVFFNFFCAFLTFALFSFLHLFFLLFVFPFLFWAHYLRSRRWLTATVTTLPFFCRVEKPCEWNCPGRKYVHYAGRGSPGIMRVHGNDLSVISRSPRVDDTYLLYKFRRDAPRNFVLGYTETNLLRRAIREQSDSRGGAGMEQRCFY